jgi:hypothetical protein
MTKTFQGEDEKNYIDGVLTVLGLLAVSFMMLALLGACASLPRDTEYDGAVGGAAGPSEPARCTDICWVMTARNDNYYEARAYINGRRIATLPGLMAKPVAIPISRSMLDGAGCMVVTVQLYPDTKRANSTRECPVPGSRLQLAVGESYGGFPLQLYLQDWRTRR